MWENLDVILIFSENEMSTWEDLVVNEPHLSSLPPALASSLVKELQETRGVAKVKLQNEMPCFFPRHSFKWQNRMTLPLQSPGQEPSKKGSYLSSIRRRRWLHFYFQGGCTDSFFLMFISTEGAPRRPMTYDNHPTQPIHPIPQSLFSHLNRPQIDLSRPPIN